MRLCPDCRRSYADETLNFCLDDGSALVDGRTSLSNAATVSLGAVESHEAGIGGMIVPAPAGTTPFRETSNSIAILPFTNISADPENEYFCDGLAEELLHALAKIDDLKVAARTSAFSFKGKNANVADIASALGVRAVLQGSIQKSGDRVRISVQLVDALNGYHLWSERFDRVMEDIFDIQDEISLAVVNALKLKLLGVEKAAVLKRHTENTEAYKAYLKGRYLRHARNDHGGALAAYKEAIRLDPSHGPSWVGVAESSVLAAHYGLIQARQACDEATAALAVASEMQGETADALYVAGFIAYVKAEWDKAIKAFDRALEIDPAHVSALGSFGMISCVHGNIDIGMSLFERARDADPLAPFPYAITGFGFTLTGEPEKALPYFEQAFTFEGKNILAIWSSCAAQIALGRFEEGIAAAKLAVEVSRQADFFAALLGWAYAAAGKTDDANDILTNLRNRVAGAPTLVPEIWLLAALGEDDAAIELLSRAVDEDQPFAYYSGLAGFDPLRSNPRFKAMLQRLDLPEY